MKNLLIIPCAGGTRIAYNKMFQALEHEYKLHFLPLSMESENFQILTMESLIKEIDMILKTGNEWTLLGHSMGGILAMYYMSVGKNRKKIQNNFICSSPHPKKFEDLKNKITFQNTIELKNYLYQLGGLSKETIESNVFDSYMIPRIKKDLELIKSIRSLNLKAINNVSAGLSFICGRDEIEDETYRLWLDEKISCTVLPGGHFALFENKEIIISLIKKRGAITC